MLEEIIGVDLSKPGVNLSLNRIDKGYVFNSDVSFDVDSSPVLSFEGRNFYLFNNEDSFSHFFDYLESRKSEIGLNFRRVKSSLVGYFNCDLIVEPSCDTELVLKKVRNNASHDLMIDFLDSYHLNNLSFKEVFPGIYMTQR